MEPNEVQELHEQQEQGRGEAEHEEPGRSLKHVSFSMAVIAVLVALVTVLGHRTHTEAVLMQARASDQWNLYQAKKIRQNDTQLAVDLLSGIAQRDNQAAQVTIAGYKAHMAKWAGDLAQEQDVAHQFEEKVEGAERKAARFDLAEALLEIGLVVTSITLLTRLRVYWLLGLGFGIAGLAFALNGLLLH
jgi:urease accessory protein UreH